MRVSDGVAFWEQTSHGTGVMPLNPRKMADDKTDGRAAGADLNEREMKEKREGGREEDMRMRMSNWVTK